MELTLFSTKEEYIKYIKDLEAFPTFKLGEAFSRKDVLVNPYLWRYPYRFTKKMVLKIHFRKFIKRNKLKAPKLVFTKDKEIDTACFKTSSNVILYQEALLEKELWYNYFMLTHELSHFLIYQNKELFDAIMKLSHEVKDSLKEHTRQNNVILPEELYANALMLYILKEYKKNTEVFEKSLFEGFKKEIKSL